MNIVKPCIISIGKPSIVLVVTSVSVFVFIFQIELLEMVLLYYKYYEHPVDNFCILAQKFKVCTSS